MAATSVSMLSFFDIIDAAVPSEFDLEAEVDRRFFLRRINELCERHSIDLDFYESARWQVKKRIQRPLMDSKEFAALRDYLECDL